MSLAFSGPGGSVERRWIVYALLRDNVQHHIEGGKPTEAFSALYRVAEALGGEQVAINAKKLQAEVLRAKELLLGRPVAELAISGRTHTVISMRWPPPAERHTMLLSETGCSLPITEGARQLDDIFGSLITELLMVTEGASDSDEVVVSDL